MKRLNDQLFRGLEALMVLCLAAMVVMVFGNAALRKLSDFGLVLLGGGIDVSEEMSRIVFVWLTFIGAVVVMRENAHLGVEMVVASLGDTGRRICLLLSDALIVVCCLVFLWGTIRQAPLHMGNVAPITGLSMIWVYGIGAFTSIAMMLLTLPRMWRALTGRLDPAELRAFAGEQAPGQGPALKERLE
jgi:TRAP-type C4-dicarboxylate transport system permease small subunit